MTSAYSQPVAVIGGGPAGLMAAEAISAAGYRVDLFDAMPSVGRKFLLAGIGGLNLTHSEEPGRFLDRFGAHREALRPLLEAFDAGAVRRWAQSLGIDTFVGSSGRVFPSGMKAAPLLRRWLQRLRQQGVAIHVRHRWLGWDERGALSFATPAGEKTFEPAATVLALGGGSWARLGSDGAWVDRLRRRGIGVAPLLPANCGFEVAWSDHLRSRFAGHPLKSVAVSFTTAGGEVLKRRGELMITGHGVEGSLIYALSAPLRDAILRDGSAVVHLDLAPDRPQENLLAALSKPRGSRSLAKHLHGRAGIDGVKAALLREAADTAQLHDAETAAALIKALPLTLRAARPLDEAISSAGGVRFEMLDGALMLRALPGHFCAGEMLDWEAPTGGYLLTACLASGRCAGEGAAAWLRTMRVGDGGGAVV